jgi:iron(III) transport system ATP-binding protein
MKDHSIAHSSKLNRNTTDSLIEFCHVCKKYGQHNFAVNDVSLSVPRSKLVVLLGSSGCGKTTMLRLIAGLETPTSGEIWLDNVCVSNPRKHVPPEQRHVGMVFQDYALFPHLTVFDNVLFPITKQPRDQRYARANELLDRVGLSNFAKRYPHQLSGGQQQRVALARALSARPSVVLLDEPFSNLDAALRREMREELLRVLRHEGATTVFVTHDQEEALSIADVIVVMHNGKVSQVGTPHDIYLRPVTRQVAEFIGEANFISGHADGDFVVCALGSLKLMNRAHGAVHVLIRPEQIRLSADPNGEALIKHLTFYGHDQIAIVESKDALRLQSRLKPQPGIAVGQTAQISVRGAVMAYPVHADNSTQTM